MLQSFEDLLLAPTKVKNRVYVFTLWKLTLIFDFYLYGYLLTKYWVWWNNHYPQIFAHSCHRTIYFLDRTWIQWARSAPFAKFVYIDYKQALILWVIMRRWAPFGWPNIKFVVCLFQMSSIDAAIDRRISESRLAGRMAF